MHVSSLVPHTCGVNRECLRRVNDVKHFLYVGLSIHPLWLNPQVPPSLASPVHHFFAAASADLHSVG